MFTRPNPQGFESFVVRCPREVTPHLSRIINVALQYIKYDPNYSYGDEDEGNGDEDVDMDAEEEEEVQDAVCCRVLRLNVTYLSPPPPPSPLETFRCHFVIVVVCVSAWSDAKKGLL